MRDLLLELGLDVVGPARRLHEAQRLIDEHPGLDVAVLDV
jgi:hypothetical protein